MKNGLFIPQFRNSAILLCLRPTYVNALAWSVLISDLEDARLRHEQNTLYSFIPEIKKSYLIPKIV